MVVSRLILLKMRNVLDRIAEKNKPHFMFKIFFSKNYAVYEVMFKNVAEPEMSQLTIY
jgi:hypothetical protein